MPISRTDPFTTPLQTSLFWADASLAGTRLAFAGLRFEQCSALGPPAALAHAGGGAIRCDNLTVPLAIGCCRFFGNRASDFGGAVYLSHVQDARIECSQFEQNTAEHVVVGTDPVCDRGMGGAVASLESTLVVSDSAFSMNSALVVSPGGAAPPLGSAGGGGDVYVKNGTFRMFSSRSRFAEAGSEPDNNNPASEELNGDGGSILVHGQHKSGGATLEISTSVFEEPVSYGNGGAISLSYDSSVAGRAYLVKIAGAAPPTPIPLSGSCSGFFAGVAFFKCNGGWQGGAVSANGSRMQLALSDCSFVQCKAGTSQIRDGKGGAISVCGGIQCPMPPANSVVMNGCRIESCTATGNGGGMYSTIRASLELENETIVEDCWALRSLAELNGQDMSQFEGLGGAAHVSAGGHFKVSGACILRNNSARSCGGGISAKSAKAIFSGIAPAYITGNSALGTGNWGNGGGIYVTTGRYDGEDGPLVYALFLDDGTVESTGIEVSISNNYANRWGGAVYAGVSWTEFSAGATKLLLEYARVSHNTATIGVPGYSGVSPSQIALERVNNNALIPPTVSFLETWITGNSPIFDAGIYAFDSLISGGMPIHFTSGTLAYDILFYPPP